MKIAQAIKEQNQSWKYFDEKSKEKNEPVVRTILNINNEDNSMILAGDMPLHSKVQLMMASIDGIAGGAQKAAQIAM